MIAGAHLCELNAVQQTVEGGKPSVNFLLEHVRGLSPSSLTPEFALIEDEAEDAII